jgi:hypothetical protein
MTAGRPILLVHQCHHRRNRRGQDAPDFELPAGKTYRFADVAAVKSHASVVAGKVVLAVNATNKITFANLDQVSDLHANDFLFV